MSNRYGAMDEQERAATGDDAADEVAAPVEEQEEKPLTENQTFDLVRYLVKQGEIRMGHVNDIPATLATYYAADLLHRADIRSVEFDSRSVQEEYHTRSSHVFAIADYSLKKAMPNRYQEALTGIQRVSPESSNMGLWSSSMTAERHHLRPGRHGERTRIS